MNLRLRLAGEWLAIGMIATAVVIGALLWRGTSSFDNLIYDRVSAASRPPADRQILLVNIDDPSLAALGKWPWDRNLHAELIEKLQTKKPRSIAFDILLSERGNAAADARLAASLAVGPAPVFMPLHFNAPGSNGRAYDTVPPAAPFAGTASGLGHVNIVFDDDGILRRGALCFQPEAQGDRWPHLMELVYGGAQGGPSAAAQRDIGCNAELLIPFSPAGAFAEISYADLLAGEIPDEMIAGKDVIIGATAAGMGDNFPTPNGEGGLLSGIEVMANMMGAIRRDDFITPLPLAWVAALSLLPLWLLLIGLLRWRPRVVMLMSLATLGMIVTLSTALLARNIWFPPGAALLGVLLVYPLWGWRRLQAMSDFMTTELRALENEGEVSPIPLPHSTATDLVGRQSEALAGAIDHMRDLRRFVADTLADLPDPMFVTDPDGKVTLTNDLFDERLGCDVADMPRSTALDLMVADEQRALVDRYLEHPHDAASPPEFVRFVSRQDRTFVMRRSEVRGDSDALHGHIHYLTDITDLARAEAEREQILQLLSHDMRAPQSTIIALLEGEVTADAKRRIEQNARRTMQLAQDFVEMARMGETAFAGEEVLLADLVREAADGLWPLAHERGITFAFDDTSEAAFVLAEPDSLQRAICNLIDNAIKFSPDNGVIHISLTHSDAKPTITVTISDQGNGIADHILPNLFTRFATGGEYQGRAKGTGLGLHFVQAVIERHNGSIDAENDPAGGACFRFELPVAPDI